MKNGKLNRDEFLKRLTKMRGVAPKNSPLAVFFNAHPEYKKPNKSKVRNVWNGITVDFKILEKFEKLFIG